MSHELQAKAVILLHRNGQVIHQSGWLEEREFPAMAALVAAMTSAGTSLGSLGENSDKGSPTRFHCESESTALYVISINEEYWLATLYDQPLNPGLFRMKVRRYGEDFSRLGVSLPKQWEEASAAPAGATLPPSETPKMALFENITDDEIDSLFNEARG